MASWVGSCEITKNLINLDLTKIIQFCLKIYDLWRHPYLWMDVWLGLWVGSCEINKNHKNLDLIKIIQFCLKIYDLQPSHQEGVRHSIPLGIAVQIPEEHYGILAPKSGLSYYRCDRPGIIGLKVILEKDAIAELQQVTTLDETERICWIL